MLRKCLIIISLLCCLFLSGCGFLYNTSVDNENKSPRSTARDTRDKVLEYVKSNNSDGISGLFSEAEPVQADDIQNLLDLIQGEIIFIETNGIHGGAAESKGGRYTYYSYAANMTVYTDLGMEYIVAFGGIAVWDGHPEQIGIDSFTVIDEQTGERYDI